MRRTQLRKPRKDQGVTLIEVMIVLVIIFLLASMAMPLYANAQRQAREKSLVADCRYLFDALTRYYVDKGAYPSEAQLDYATLSPLSTEDYFPSVTPFTQKLVGNQLTYYVAPDVDGPDQQFIVVTRHINDPSIIVAVVSSNIVDEDDRWVEGVFVITEEDLADAGL